MEQYFMPWVGKWIQLLGQILVGIAAIWAAYFMQPNMQYLPSQRATATPTTISTPQATSFTTLDPDSSRN